MGAILLALLLHWVLRDFFPDNAAFHCGPLRALLDCDHFWRHCRMMHHFVTVSRNEKRRRKCDKSRPKNEGKTPRSMSQIGGKATKGGDLWWRFFDDFPPSKMFPSRHLFFVFFFFPFFFDDREEKGHDKIIRHYSPTRRRPGLAECDRRWRPRRPSVDRVSLIYLFLLRDWMTRVCWHCLHSTPPFRSAGLNQQPLSERPLKVFLFFEPSGIR